MTSAAERRPAVMAAEELVVLEEPGLFSPDLWWGIARRRIALWLGLAIAGSVLMGLKEARRPPSYSGSFRMLVQPLVPQQSLGKLTDDKQGSAPPPTDFDYSTQIEVLLSPHVLEPVAQRLARLYPDTTLETVTEGLKVERLAETKILEVSYSDGNPGRVRTLLQELATTYLRVGREQQRSDAKRGLEFVNRELPSVRRQVDTLQLQIRGLQQQYGFTNPATYSEGLESQVAKVVAQRSDLQLKLVDLQAQMRGLQRESTLLKRLAGQALPVPELQTLRQELARESARLGPRNPRVLILKRQERNLLPVLQADKQQQLRIALVRLQTQVEGLVYQDQLLQEQERTARTRLAQLPRVQEELAALNRNLDIAESSLKRFLESRQQLSIQSAQTDAPWQLTTPPGAPQPAPSSSIYRSLLSGAIAGALVGLALGYAIERLRNTSYTLEEFKRRCSEPVLGVIPLNRELATAGRAGYVVDLRLTESQDGAGNYWLEAYDAYGFFESFRSLCAQLQVDGAGQRVQSVALCSGQPQEGTSTVAIHLAQAAAALGRRVMLVDTHLRRGGTQLHQLLGLPNEVGLSTWLQQEQPLDRVIQPLEWESALGVITAGPLPSDPSRLLAGDRMRQLMVQLATSHDLVIYDLPPVHHLADVKLVARAVDGVAMVHSLGRPGNASALRESLLWLRTSPVPLLGVIVNRVSGVRVDPYAKPA